MMYGREFRIILLMAFVAISQAIVAAPSTEPRKGPPPVAKAMGGRPLKIYILAGQSNMQGQAQLSTVPRMALSPESKALHDKMLDENGQPKVHKNVSIVYFTGGDISKGEARPLQEKKGLLAAGAVGSIGPDIAFGITMDENADAPILIIKTAWGGRSLYHHFRPPSAGLLKFELPKKRNNPITPEEMKAREKAHNETQGLYYRLIVELVKGVLADPGKYCDAYDPKEGYEIAGFGWFQGFNDMIAGGSDLYKASGDRPQFAAYTDLLAHLIRDLRKDLNAPKMPAVIGIVGIGGEKANDPFRKAQAATAEVPDLKGTVVTVETGKFWDKDVQEAGNKVAEAEGLWEKAEGWEIVGTPAPKDRIWHYTSFTIDAKKQYEILSKFHRTFNHETPAELKDWLKNDFDVSTWQKGPAPVGKGTLPKSKGKKGNDKEAEDELSVRSPSGDGNMLLMKTTFTLERSDISNFRLCLRSTGSFHVYLNGQPIKDYAYWSGIDLRKWDIDAKVVKQGVNELAFYGNIMDHKGTTFNAVDLYLEGLPKEKADEIARRQNEIAPPRIRELAKGKSNQDFHYLGSAYTYSLVGEAMAKALMGLETSGKAEGGNLKPE